MEGCTGSPVLSTGELSTENNNEAVTISIEPRQDKVRIPIEGQYFTRMMHRMNEMRHDNVLCDIEIKAAGGKIFKAHCSVLMAASTYFEAMISSGLLESKERRIQMHNVSPSIMSSLLEFFYTGELEVDWYDLQPLMAVAGMIQMEDVIAGCSIVMEKEIKPSNALGIYRFAETHNLTAICKMSQCYVEMKFVAVMEGEEFLDLPLDVLTFFLSSEGLEVDSEMQVFQSAVLWLFHDPLNRRQHVMRVLKHVRLGLLHPRLTSMMALALSEQLQTGGDVTVIWIEVVETANSQHITRHEDAPRLNAKKWIVEVGGFCCESSCYSGPNNSGGDYSTTSYGPCTTVVVFDVLQRQWIQAGTCRPPTLPPHRYIPDVIAISGNIYLVGGTKDEEKTPLGTVEPLDARACFLDKSQTNIFIRSKSPVLQFHHLDLHWWLQVSRVEKCRYDFELCKCFGRIYAIGGCGGSVPSIESYDPIADKWQLEGYFPGAGQGVCSIFHKGQIYVLGRRTSKGNLSPELMRLTPPGSSAQIEKNPFWCSEPVKLAPMRIPKSHMGVAILHDSLYAVGGRDFCNHPLTLVEAYSFSENEWHDVANLCDPQQSPSVVAVDDKLYSIGGPYTNDDGWTLQMYDPIENKWELMPSLPHGKRECRIVAV